MNTKYFYFTLLMVGILASNSLMAQRTIEIEQSLFIDVPREQLWEITALQFDKIGVWSAGVKDSEGHGVGENGAVCKERQCEPGYKGFKETTERIIDYQPEQFHFTYEIAEGLPKMVTNATNQWLHEEQDKGTKMTMKINMQLKGFQGFLMKGLMKKKMKKILKQNLEELKIYAETGELHERKKKLNQKLAAQ